MRAQILAFAAAVAIGTATMTTGALARHAHGMAAGHDRFVSGGFSGHRFGGGVSYHGYHGHVPIFPPAIASGHAPLGVTAGAVASGYAPLGVTAGYARGRY